MNPQVPDELISAYFDGEVSPFERAEVERLLTGNDDARRALNETAQLSALLHSFPREAAPVELAANVLRQTNLIPLPPLPLPVSATKTSAQNVWRDWKAGFAGAAITAAAMCLILVLNTNHSHEQAGSPLSTGLHVEMASAPVRPDAATPAEPIVAMDNREMLSQKSGAGASFGTELDLGQEVDASAKQASTVPVPKSMSRGRALSEREALGPPAISAAMSDSAATLSTNQAALPDAQAFGFNELGQSNDEFVRGLREGKVYVVTPQPADPDSNVAVVYFEVVDIDRGAETVQVLLKKNSIEARSVNNDAQPMPDDLVMMYIRASGDQIAKTLKDVDQHRDLISNWTAQAPLPLAAAGDEVAPQAQQQKVADRRAPADKEQKPEQSGSLTESDSDMPEAQVVLNAYAQRNGFANSPMSNPIANSNGLFGGNRDGTENQKRQQIANSGRETNKADFSPRAGNTVANQGQSNQSPRNELGYDYIRLNNSLAVNNGTISSQSVASQLNPLRAEPRSQVSVSNSKKVTENDVNGRVFRMLFVLHPQSAGAQGRPSPAPAKAP
ncbi:MAG: hypothetical protein JWP89_4689 [Schlesneria sp.]|nr:hypothetical protein [Schlesneria sp.]